MQIFLYEQLNKKYRKNAENKKALDGTGPMTFDIAVKKRVEYN